MEPRQPTYEESKALQRHLMEHPASPADVDLAIKFSFLTAIAVFDDYKGEDGYVGPIIIVVWPMGPQFYQVFRFDQHGRLTHVKQDQAIARAYERCGC